MKLATQVLGLEDVRRNFDELGRRAQNQVLRKGLRAGGNAVRQRMRQKARRRRGKLAAGIQTKVTISRGVATVEIAPRRKEFYGTIHDIGSRKMAGNQWMRNALIESKDAILDAVRDAWGSELSNLGG